MEDKSNISEAGSAVPRHHTRAQGVIKRDWEVFTASKSVTIVTDIHGRMCTGKKWFMALSGGSVGTGGCFSTQPSQFPSHSSVEGLSISHPLTPALSKVGVSLTSAFQAADLQKTVLSIVSGDLQGWRHLPAIISS